MSEESFTCSECEYSGDSFSGFGVHCSLNDDHDEESIMREYAVNLVENFGDVGDKAPRAKAFYNESHVSRNFIRSWFDGYEDLIEKSHLRQAQLSEKDLVEDIQRVSSKIGKTPKKKDYDEYGKFSADSICYVIGSWNEGLKKAGFKILSHRNISKRQLKEEIRRLAEEVGGKPTSRDMEKQGQFAVNTYLRKFDSWNGALEECGFSPTKQHFDKGEKNMMYNVGKEHPLYGKRGEEHPAWGGGGTNYGNNWYEKRNEALERANNTCEHPNCNKSKCNNGRDLHCHHIVPNKLTEDENKHNLDNLIMLCNKHHNEVEPVKRTTVESEYLTD